MRWIKIAAISLMGIIAHSGVAHTTSDISPLVAERKAAMKTMAEAALTIASMFEGRRPYDATDFMQAASAIASRSGVQLTEAFPDETVGPPYAAKLDIATSRQEFNALASHFDRIAGAFSDAADRAPEELTQAMRMAPGTRMDGGPLGKKPGKTPEVDLTAAPVEHLFHLMVQDCNSCHARFREQVR